MSVERISVESGASTAHERGEYVPGLGWSCVTCDTFGCPVANAPTDACTRKGCGRPKAEHAGGFCP